jgi:hypothetical protein
MLENAIINLQLPLHQVNQIAAALSTQPLGKVLNVFLAIREQTERQVAEIQAGPNPPGGSDA